MALKRSEQMKQADSPVSTYIYIGSTSLAVMKNAFLRNNNFDRADIWTVVVCQRIWWTSSLHLCSFSTASLYTVWVVVGTTHICVSPYRYCAPSPVCLSIGHHARGLQWHAKMYGGARVDRDIFACLQPDRLEKLPISSLVLWSVRCYCPANVTT